MIELRQYTNGKITVLAEQSVACALESAFSTVFGREAEHFIWRPALEQSLELPLGDCILLTLVSDRQSATLCGRLGVSPWSNLSNGAYAIETAITRRGRCLAVIGGDTYGLLAGLWDVLVRLELTDHGATYKGNRMVERPFFAHRFFWSWDHSANWSEGPGQIDWGYNNAYAKPSAAFLEDYRHQIDYAPQARVNGIIIAGFLRDDHGGVAAAQKVLAYGKSRHVRVLPCVCTTGYGGLYYQGVSPFSEEIRLAVHPDHAAIGYSGKPLPRLCPSHPETADWQRAAIRWLFSTFDIDGAELEISDYAACQCPRCRERRAQMGGVDADYLKEIHMSYAPVLDQLLAGQPNGVFPYAVFTGFNFDLKMTPAREAPVRVPGARPDFISRLPPEAVCLWTISEMLHDPQVPLCRWLDDGKSQAFYEGDRWPHGLRAPAPRNMALLHQGNGWSRNECHTRYGVEISSIKEACLRGVEAGLEGVVFYGEVSNRCVPCELNYQAFAHFTYHPEDSLREFSRRRLAPLLGGEEAAERFIEALAETEQGPASTDRYRQVDEEGIHWREQVSGRHLRQGEAGAHPPLADSPPAGYCRLRAVQIWRRWEWLRRRALRGPALTDTDYLPFP